MKNSFLPVRVNFFFVLFGNIRWVVVFEANLIFHFSSLSKWVRKDIYLNIFHLPNHPYSRVSNLKLALYFWYILSTMQVFQLDAPSIQVWLRFDKQWLQRVNTRHMLQESSFSNQNILAQKAPVQKYHKIFHPSLVK